MLLVNPEAIMLGNIDVGSTLPIRLAADGFWIADTKPVVTDSADLASDKDDAIFDPIAPMPELLLLPVREVASDIITPVRDPKLLTPVLASRRLLDTGTRLLGDMSGEAIRFCMLPRLFVALLISETMPTSRLANMADLVAINELLRPSGLLSSVRCIIHCKRLADSLAVIMLCVTLRAVSIIPMLVLS